MQLSVIIVNYNVKYFLEYCLLSVIKASAGIEAEIIVVDNNSTDGSRAYLADKFPSVKFFWNKENAGFAKANNSVLSQTKGEHILFLNPDTIVPEDCFIKCLAFFKSHEDCGALGVRMIDGSGQFLKESKRSLPTPASGFYKMTGAANAFPASEIFAQYYAGQLPEKENNKVEVLSGAFMMLSKNALEKTKGFDEAFFMYGEDIDLSYRVTQSGLNNYYLGEITIIHFKGESTQKKSPLYRKYFYGAIKLFIDKHYNKQKVKHALMSVVIAGGKILAGIRKNLSSAKPVAIKGKTIPTILVGLELQYEKVTVLLRGTDYLLQDFFIPRRDFNVKQFLKVIEERNIQTIIFCENERFKYGDIISWLQCMPNGCQSFFYAEGAESIIGSSNKNEKGIFISKR